MGQLCQLLSGSSFTVFGFDFHPLGDSWIEDLVTVDREIMEREAKAYGNHH